jgi:hypothetical protein
LRDSFKVTKGQLAKLVNIIEGTDLMEATLRQVTVEGRNGILVTWVESDQMGDVKHKALVVGDGVVKL